ncbi:corticotropin-releasing factor-binding protein [Puma concolor]|uniref:Corticotropin-releasing factor-binding protein n=1 Tax=Puma concolor TaxID=9696 RepID=A0A6P6HVY3_PUMCO|nr:corticotropin-releasing factor-binding protein [Puma concolor]
MSPSFKLQCHFILILMALRGESRYLELREAADHDPLRFLGANLKRELAGEPLYRRALRESGCRRASGGSGEVTRPGSAPAHGAPGTAGKGLARPAGGAIPVLRGPPDGRGWVFDGWILKGEKFPSSQDHPLPTTERYIDFCDSGLSRRSIRSSQNVAMIFFRVRQPGNGFTVTIKTDPNLFPCNVISQTPNGRFTLVVPHLHRNCSFSIIYPVVIKISDLTLGHLHGLQSKNPSAGCGGIGDFVELLGGTGLDPSKMMPLADLCYSFHGPAQMKIGCDNTVVRMVSSGKHVNRVTFEYRQLEPYELENPNGNSIQEICLSTL